MLLFFCLLLFAACDDYVLCTHWRICFTKNTRTRTYIQFSKQPTIQMTKMLAIVTFVFLISVNVPYITMVYAMINTPTNEPEMSVVLGLSTVVFINTFFNPFLYVALK